MMHRMYDTSHDNVLEKDPPSSRHHDGSIMEHINKSDIDEEFDKSVPNVSNLRKLLERREHMLKMHVFEDTQGVSK